MNEKCTTDQDNGIAERREQPVGLQQRMSAMLNTLFLARQDLTILFKQRDCHI